ncbi:ets DNA-binding protein pokkuri [Ostrinia nubilalis]|uniref:ets DNA-binding protein pokkuri n=1 Tax=Ostrinia furnacalis TaxID=93504 RepID=UPI0010392F07|nr:ets DNA-binding protein pokkuri [Ostrinia furnacalis]
MTYTMPTQARCDRVPPADGGKWDALDLRVLQEDDLPLDPRSWGRAEVGRWVSRRGGLPERFPMNGKALCLMSKDMFASRVPDGGHMLHQDFRRRLAKALALQELFEKLSPK